MVIQRVQRHAAPDVGSIDIGFEGDAKVTPDGLCPMVWVEGLSITGEA